ncbi:MAG: hypothetical protein H6625_09155 [Bdellovibrionaceae bacterium]|nr:hypothetical protein [Pseudobdellovibrionaceae bacterium]
MRSNLFTKKHLLVYLLGFLPVLFLMQNCDKTPVQFTQLNLQEGEVDNTSTSLNDIPSKQALVYGSSPEDRQFLEDRITNFKAPGMDQIFGNWRRLAGSQIYPTANDIVMTPGTEYCFTTLDPLTGFWELTIDPSTGNQINPSTHGECANDPAFSASSWSFFKNPDRLHTSTNAGVFNGFISGIPYENYTNEVTLTSDKTDDDVISLIIAMLVDEQGVVHSLSASRSQGGFVAHAQGMDFGWGIIYRQNNEIINVFGARSVGGTNENKVSGDKKGWNGRKTRVKVNRAGNIIKAEASNWSMESTNLSYDPESLIELDLSDNSLGLEIFKKPAYYGYGVHSQSGAQFQDIVFSMPFQNEFIYDLQGDLVYERNEKGVYNVLSGQSAFEALGYPSRIGNVETQKEFHLESFRKYSRIK